MMMNPPFNPDKDTNDVLTKLRDRSWRLENLYFIEDKKGHVTKFKLNPIQKLLLKNLHSRNIILKARQLGMSTFIAMFFLDDSLFRSNRKSAIVADKDASAKNIFAKIEFAWRGIPERFKSTLGLTLETDSASKVKFSNGSEIVVGTTIHSGTYQNLHVSEYGPLCATSPDKAEIIAKSAFPTVPDDPESDSYIFIESTAEGEGNDYWQRCMDAMEAQERALATNTPLHFLEYRFHFFPWWINPEYNADPKGVTVSTSNLAYLIDLQKTLDVTFTPSQLAWYELKSRDIKDRMKEQYPSFPEEAFLTSGNKLFNAEIIKAKLTSDTRPPIEQDNHLSIYAHYKRGHRYALGADVAQGIGRDSSTIVVIDFTKNEIVATYHSNKIDPVAFAHEIMRVGNMYGSCLAAPEANNVGHTTVVTLNEIYSNIYYYELKGYTQDKETERLGWLSNLHTKPRMMYDLADAFQSEETPLICPDPAILREALAYQKDDATTPGIQRPQAAQHTTRHFDLLTAAAIAWQMNAHATITSSIGDMKTKARIFKNRARVKGYA